jgi:hypothetical protein
MPNTQDTLKTLPPGTSPSPAGLCRRAGVSAQDIDVALIYDHFTPMAP